MILFLPLTLGHIQDGVFVSAKPFRPDLFYAVEAWGQCYKTFLSVIYGLRNKLECLYLKAFAAYSYKHSSLVRKSVNYGQKGFISLGPEPI
jgi:hypothetical protein